MGTYYTDGATRRDIIAELTQGWKRDKASKVVERHCARGNVLWTLECITTKGEDFGTLFIGCYLLTPHKDGWGYKPMDESMGPYYFTCPLAYLKAAPEICGEWRDGVREYHAQAKAKRGRAKIVREARASFTIGV